MTRLKIAMMVLAAGMVLTGCAQDPPQILEQENQAVPEKQKEAQREEQVMDPTWHLDNGNTYLSQARAAGGQVPDFQKTFPAMAIDPGTFTPVDATADITIDGQPLFWLTPDKTQAVVDERYFSDLTVVSGRSGGGDEGVLIGTFKGGETLDGMSLMKFLMFSGAVEVNWHTTAEVFVLDAGHNDMGYRATFLVKDTYFTNEENTDEFRFLVGILKNGEMWVH